MMPKKRIMHKPLVQWEVAADDQDALNTLAKVFAIILKEKPSVGNRATIDAPNIPSHDLRDIDHR
jgi:hypothetical protein